MTTSEQLHGQGPGDIRELLARIKNGDEEASRELLSRYESKVRLVVRRQLPRLLRSRFDSIDFLQSVWGSFFHRIQTESNDLNEEENLIAFLAGPRGTRSSMNTAVPPPRSRTFTGRNRSRAGETGKRHWHRETPRASWLRPTRRSTGSAVCCRRTGG